MLVPIFLPAGSSTTMGHHYLKSINWLKVTRPNNLKPTHEAQRSLSLSDAWVGKLTFIYNEYTYIE